MKRGLNSLKNFSTVGWWIWLTNRVGPCKFEVACAAHVVSECGWYAMKLFQCRRVVVLRYHCLPVTRHGLRQIWIYPHQSDWVWYIWRGLSAIPLVDQPERIRSQRNSSAHLSVSLLFWFHVKQKSNHVWRSTCDYACHHKMVVYDRLITRACYQ